MTPELEAALSLCRNLPSPPGVALRILDLAQQPDVDLATAADAISKDPALSARMLRIANSPLYGKRRRVENLYQALTLLGMNAALSLALGFSLVQSLRGSEDTREQYEAVWRRSVLAALAARVLGQKAGSERLEELMLAALLQDIGALALLQVRPEDYPALLREATGPADRLRRERAILGCDHGEVGAWLAQRWNLPPYLQQAILASEAPDDGDRFHACVAASGPVAELWLDTEGDGQAARERALAEVAARLALDRDDFDEIIAQMSDALPDIAVLFEVRITRPEHIDAIVDHARELLVLRNLREIQETARARHDADTAERRVRQLAEQVRRDPLTGAYNRIQLEEVLEREFAAAVRLGIPLSVAFLDLDDFKQINDRHGHLVGDQVLREFATALTRQLRHTDLVARYGGEEFLIVLVNSGAEAALQALRRVLDEIARTPMATVDGKPLYVTFSAGLATQGGEAQFASARDLLKAADEALYGAKREGRNRITLRPL